MYCYGEQLELHVTTLYCARTIVKFEQIGRPYLRVGVVRSKCINYIYPMNLSCREGMSCVLLEGQSDC